MSWEFLIGTGIGCAIGAFIAWLNAKAQNAGAQSKFEASERQLAQASSDRETLRVQLDEERQLRVAAQTSLSESNKRFEEQSKTLNEAQEKLVTTFRALSDEALKSNNEAFLQLARETMDRALTEAKGDLGLRQEAIRGLVKPIEDTLGRYQEELGKLEKNRHQVYGELKQQIASLADAEEKIKVEAENLVSALRLPQVRGRWGEMTLRRVVELSGMSEHCEFEEQHSLDTEEGQRRPDLVIQLPAGRKVVVDAKTSLDAYMDAIKLSSEQDRDKALRRHASQLRSHMSKLSSKAYWTQFPDAPEFVIMFIPGESFFSAAIRFDQTLIEDGIANRVVLATPTTIIALLRSIAYGWRQEQLAKNAQEIAQLGKELYERFQTFFEHVAKLKGSLQQSVEAFNKMCGSLDRRVLPTLKKFRELGATGQDDLPEVQSIEQTTRQLNTDEAVQNDTMESIGSVADKPEGG